MHTLVKIFVYFLMETDFVQNVLQLIDFHL